MAHRPTYAIPSVDARDVPETQSVVVTTPVEVVGGITVEPHIDFPSLFTVNGTVTVDDMPDVAGTVAVSSLPPVTVANPTDVSGLLTNSQLRATPVSVKEQNVLVPYAYDSIVASYPSAAVEVYAYKAGATTVATVTVTYTDASKAAVVSVVRT